MQKVIFLDRDGTLNVDHGFVHRVEDFHWIEKVPEAIALLRRQGAIGIVTNQSGIARGLYSVADVELLHKHVAAHLEGCIDAIAYCPHGPDDACRCRKPDIGMARQIEDQLGKSVDYASSWMVGDRPSDIEFGIRLGAKTALIRSAYWDVGELRLQPDLVVDSLYEAAVLISRTA